MQDIHAGDGGGRFFGGGGDRRLRPHNHHHALKCPRCDSLNTKFCYYNNYNLSQPRHFCKSCRRYWTKGGVLRNVPVGGGCRKTKRAAKPRSSAAAGDAPTEGKSSYAQSSSSGSSSLTAAVREEGSAVPPATTTSSNSAAVVYNFHDSRFFSSSSANPNFDHHDETTDGQIFPTEIGSFTSMMTSSEEVMGLGRGRLAPVEDHNSNSGSWPTMVVGTTTHVDDQFNGDEGGMSNDDGLAAALDWGGGDQGLFDLTAANDPANYWTQPQWTTITDHNDQSLNYLP